MPIIELKPVSCKHCDSGKRSINIDQFRKDFAVVSESALRMWGGKTKCWICKKLPVIDETWGISISVGEKNRLYCPECAEVIEQKLAAQGDITDCIHIADNCLFHGSRYCSKQCFRYETAV